MVKTRRMAKDLNKSLKSTKRGKVTKNKNKNEIQPNHDSARKLRSNENTSNRNSSIDELLKKCKPCKVRLDRRECEYILKHQSKWRVKNTSIDIIMTTKITMYFFKFIFI